MRPLVGARRAARTPMKTRFDSNRAIATEDLLQAAGMNPRVDERTLTRMAQSHIDARRETRNRSRRERPARVG